MRGPRESRRAGGVWHRVPKCMNEAARPSSVHVASRSIPPRACPCACARLSSACACGRSAEGAHTVFIIIGTAGAQCELLNTGACALRPFAFGQSDATVKMETVKKVMAPIKNGITNRTEEELFFVASLFGFAQ